MFVRLLACVALITVLPGCMLTRLIDRSFLGVSVKRPTFMERQTTGIFLLPFTFAIDLVTLPIQAIIVAIAGDNFPFYDKSQELPSPLALLEQQPAFQQLDAEQRLTAARELEGLIASGQLTRDTALALGADGHWVLVKLSVEAREQMLARAGAHAQSTVLASR